MQSWKFIWLVISKSIVYSSIIMFMEQINEATMSKIFDYETCWGWNFCFKFNIKLIILIPFTNLNSRWLQIFIRFNIGNFPIRLSSWYGYTDIESSSIYIVKYLSNSIYFYDRYWLEFNQKRKSICDSG